MSDPELVLDLSPASPTKHALEPARYRANQIVYTLQRVLLAVDRHPPQSIPYPTP